MCHRLRIVQVACGKNKDVPNLMNSEKLSVLVRDWISSVVKLMKASVFTAKLEKFYFISLFIHPARKR